MTVSNDVNKAGPFVGDDANTTFAFTFKVFAAADLTVVRLNSDDTEDTLTLSSDYSVSLNADQNASPGGSITYPISGDELSTDEYLTILREVDEKQESDITNLGGFYPDVIENMADRQVMMAQQNEERGLRSLRLSRSATDAQIASMEIPASTREKYMKINADGELEFEVQSVEVESVLAANISSEAATDGWVLTADGLGNAAWEVLGAQTEVNNLSVSVTWANIPDANVPESAVTQHEAALTVTESQISDLAAYYEAGDSPTFAFITTTQSIELGHASDTTLSRVSAGKVEIESKPIIKHASASYNSGEVTFSTSAASGGSSGDIWYEYTA